MWYLVLNDLFLTLWKVHCIVIIQFFKCIIYFIPLMSFEIVILATRPQCNSLRSLKSWNIHLLDKQSNCSVCCFLGLTHLLRAPAARSWPVWAAWLREEPNLSSHHGLDSTFEQLSLLPTMLFQLPLKPDTKAVTEQHSFPSYNMEKPFFIPMRYLFYLSLLALFSHIGKLHRRLTVLKEVLLCRDYD